MNYPIDFIGQIICWDFNEIGKDIPVNSIDFCLTDPPYVKEGIPLYEEVAKLGSHILKPGGFLVVYASDYWLDKTFPKMLNYLDYYYIYHKVNNRGTGSVWQRHLFQGAKSL